MRSLPTLSGLSVFITMPEAVILLTIRGSIPNSEIIIFFIRPVKRGTTEEITAPSILLTTPLQTAVSSASARLFSFQQFPWEKS